MRLSVYDSRDLRATIAAAKASDKDIRREMRKHTQAVARPAWERAIAERVGDLRETRALHATARVSVSDQNVTLKSAVIKGKKFSGGATAHDLFAPLEFGARRRNVTYSATSPRGKRYQITRTIGAGFPAPAPKGRVVWPAAADVIPRIAALWVQTVLRTFMETIERR